MTSHACISRAIWPRFPQETPSITSRTRRSVLSVTRLNLKSAEFEIRMAHEEAFVVGFQRRAHAGYDIWQEDKKISTGPEARGSLSIVDLSTSPSAWFTSDIDKVMLHVPRPVLDELAEDAKAPRVETLSVQGGWSTVDPVFDQFEPLLVHALDNPAQNDPLFTDYLMLALSSHLAHTYGDLRAHRKLFRGGLAPWQERRAKEMLAANLGKDASLQIIAAECGLSASHFARAFRVSTGFPPHTWLQGLRVARAKKMLYTATPLAEIALHCGFSDQSHFTRIFFKSVGVTPGQWRRMNGGPETVGLPH